MRSAKPVFFLIFTGAVVWHEDSGAVTLRVKRGLLQ
jgi:hypothetical protein